MLLHRTGKGGDIILIETNVGLFATLYQKTAIPRVSKESLI